MSSNALDDLQHDMTDILHQTLSHHSLHPKNLGILPRKKAWLLHLDIVVLSDAGNIYDALFMAARASLWDTKVPKTRSIEYKARKGGDRTGDMDVDEDTASGFDTRSRLNAVDFELSDYWDEGEVLDGLDTWPICVTLNVVSPVHYLDATLQEEASTSSRLLVAFSFPPNLPPTLQAARTLGPGELSLKEIKHLIERGQGYAQSILAALNSKLHDEDLRRTQKARDKFGRR